MQGRRSGGLVTVAAGVAIALGAQEHFMKPVLGSVLGAAIARLIRPNSKAADVETIELARYRPGRTGL
jgi:hypothetical protein